jgi:hypothetical protein
LAGGVAVIKVGGSTEAMIAKKPKNAPSGGGMGGMDF